MKEEIRIRDIVQRADVSVGTVDRVLYGRPNVSPSAREKVEKVLSKMNYQPNVYASVLTYSKSYTFYLVIPRHESETYWEEIEGGAKKTVEIRRDFNLKTKTLYYERLKEESFKRVAVTCLQEKPDGVAIVPAILNLTRAFTDQLHELNIPFVLLDSYIPELDPLSFFGQDSFKSGYFSAKTLMMVAHQEKQIVLMKRNKDRKVTSKQQENREVGFRHYMSEHFPETEIIELGLPMKTIKKEYDLRLENFFNKHPQIHHCITFGSKTYIIGDFLLRTNRGSTQTMGYDTVGKNAECLRQGSVSFLVAQHVYQQGYCCIDTLFKAIVLKKKVESINYMPIELLTEENMDSYRRTQL